MTEPMHRVKLKPICELHLQIGEARPGVVKEWAPEMGDFWVCQECAEGDGPDG